MIDLPGIPNGGSKIPPVSKPLVLDGRSSGPEPVNSKAPLNPTSSTQYSVSNKLLASQFLQRLPEGMILSAKVQSLDVLTQAEKQLLLRSNSVLAKTLAQRLLSSVDRGLSKTEVSASTVQKLVSQSAIYRLGLLVSLPNQSKQTIQVITPEKFSMQQSLPITRSGEHLSIRDHSIKSVSQLEVALSRDRQVQSSSVRLLSPLVDALAVLPEKIQTQLLNRPIMAELKKLAVLSRVSSPSNHSPAKLAQTLKQAVSHSGELFERHLSQAAIVKPLSQGAVVNSTSVNASTAFESLNVQANPRVLMANIDKMLSQVNNSAQHESLQKNLEQWLNDPKQIARFLMAATHAREMVNTSTTQAKPSHSLNMLVELLLRTMGVSVAKTPGIGELPRVIAEHLKTQLHQEQRKVLLNQARSFLSDKTATEGSTGRQQTLHTDLMLRFGDQLSPLHLCIQQQDYLDENKDASSEESRKKKASELYKCWKVTLTFEFSEEDRLHAELSLVDETVSTTLWAQSATLYSQANGALQSLRDRLLASGFIVESLECIHGQPREQAISLDYRLIDLKT